MSKVPLRVSHQIIRSISDQYSATPHRVIMEFIDNSLDSAEEYFNSTTNSYKKNIKIKVKISDYQGKQAISVEDNCTGIIDVPRIVQEIGNSNKKTNRWTNGQFGFGIYSFMAIAESLAIHTRTGDNNDIGQKLWLQRSFFEQEETPEIDIQPYPRNEIGTTILLAGFDEEFFGEITINSIKDDIITHFEKLLERKNLEITLETNNKKEICEPFDYSQFPGAEIKKEIDALVLDRSGTRKLLALMGKSPIRIYLKVTKDLVLKRPPIFIAKGRRINEIKNISSFKSFNKSKVWGHPNVTGYVDLGDILSPQLDRKDFVSNKEAKAVYRALIDLENELLIEINKVTQEEDKRNFKKLEDHLNKILSKLAREDSIRYREQYMQGNDVPLAPTGIPEDFSDSVQGGKDYSTDKSNKTKGNGIGENEDGKGVGTTENLEGKHPGADGGLGPSNESSIDFDTDFQGKENKRGSGLNIEIISGEPQVNIDGTRERSIYVDGCIRIYKEHEDFKDRLKQDRSGRTIITQKLITYLAGEITIWYQDILCQKHGQQEYNVDMFRNVMTFLYRFENSLEDLRGKLLSSLQDSGDKDDE